MAAHFPDRVVRQSIEVDLALLERYDEILRDLELDLVRQAKQHDPQTFQLLRSVQGIGKILALTILYENHDVHRFDRVQEFASYARLVKCAKESAGKKKGTSGAKMGNVHLKWAFSKPRCSSSVTVPRGRSCWPGSRGASARARRCRSWPAGWGRAVYFMLVRGKAFDGERFLSTVN